MDEKVSKGGVIGGIVVALLGIVAMVGWATGVPLVMRYNPDLVPMVFNVGLLFVILGCDIVFYFLHYKRLTIYTSLAGLLFSLLTTSQTLFGWDLKIDEFFLKIPQGLFSQPNPGRAAPNTLLCFIFIFSSLLLFSKKRVKVSDLWITAIILALAISLSIVTIWGYISGVEIAYHWSNFTGMAFPTAFAIIVGASALLFEATEKIKETHRASLPFWYAILSTIVLISTTFAMTRVIWIQEEKTIKKTMLETANEYSYNICNTANNLISSIDRMGKRWKIRGILAEREWRKDAINYLHDLKGLVGLLALTDEGTLIRHVWSVEAPKKELQENIDSLKSKILSTKEPFLHLLPGNNPYLLYIFPIKEGAWQLIGVIQIHSLLDHFLTPSAKKEQSLEFKIGDDVVYAENPENKGFKKGFKADVSNTLLNEIWTLSLWPTDDYGKSVETRFPMMVLIFGSLISGTLGLVIYFAQKSLDEGRALATLNRARAAFLAQLSHELRTPLHGVIATIDLLKNSPLNEKQERYIKLLHSSGEHLLKVINAVLDLAKLEAGKIPIEVVSTDINEIAQNVTKIHSERAKEKGLFLDLKSDAPTNLLIDPTRFRQILTNLVGNAIKYTHQGNIFINLHYENDRKKGMLTISVKDTGIGISKESQKNLFEKFNKIEKQAEGTGLGLYITKAIVDMMGGSITVKSRMGEGSIFQVNLPIEKGAPSSGQTKGDPKGDNPPNPEDQSATIPSE